jgi:hypothetical protein
MLKKLSWPLIIIYASVLVGILSWSNIANVISPILIFLFMLVIPGLAYTRLFNFKDLFTELIMAVTFSIILNTILAEFMLFSHHWSPDAGLAVLIAISIYGAFIQIIKEFEFNPVRRVDDNYN